MFDKSKWEITGSSGRGVSIGTPIARLGVGANYAKFPLANLSSDKKIAVEGYGTALGTGLSTGMSSFTGVSGSFSLDEFPSDGIGKILRGNAAPNRDLVDSDFAGTAVVLAASAEAMLQGHWV